MNRYHLEIHVTPRPGVLDPEGQAIHHALHSLGYDTTREVRVGKLIQLALDAEGGEEALARADEMCRKLLANPVTERYEIALAEQAATEAPA